MLHLHRFLLQLLAIIFAVKFRYPSSEKPRSLPAKNSNNSFCLLSKTPYRPESFPTGGKDDNQSVLAPDYMAGELNFPPKLPTSHYNSHGSELSLWKSKPFQWPILADFSRNGPVVDISHPN